jgi:hypothetical protein
MMDIEGEPKQGVRAHPMAGWIAVVPVEAPDGDGLKTTDIGAFMLVELDVAPSVGAGIVTEVGAGFTEREGNELEPGDKIFFQRAASLKVGELSFVAFQGLIAKLGANE